MPRVIVNSTPLIVLSNINQQTDLFVPNGTHQE
jgi:hypothetical protein